MSNPCPHKTLKRQPCKTLRIRWAIAAMRRLFVIWDTRLDWFDKQYCLRRIRDKEPQLFYGIADEKRR